MRLKEVHARPDGHLSKVSLAERVYEATATLTLEVGTRGLRTAEIANRAEINESTLFRGVGKMRDILQGTDSWAWSRVSLQVSSIEVRDLTSRDRLLAEINTIWQMRKSKVDTAAASYAFLFFRRRYELGLAPGPEQMDFFRHVAGICARLPNTERPLSIMAAQELTTAIHNYIATVWLTWGETRLTPIATGTEVLTTQTAQLGASILIDRFIEQA